VAKKEWRKPEVRVLKAGAAEGGSGAKGQSGGGGSVFS
jgi:hypothetical protein